MVEVFKMNKNKIILYIKEKMKQEKVTQKELAKALGLPKFVVGLYMQGVIFPSIYNLELIAFKLDVNLNELLTGETELKKDDDMIYYYALKARKRRIFKIIIYIILLLAALFV